MKRRVLVSLLACMGVVSYVQTSVAADSATGSAINSEAWRKQPPKLPAPGAFNLPAVEKYKLANGMTVELVEDHRVPWTTVSLGIRTGTVNDPPGRAGLGSMVTEMLTEGTKNRTSKQIAEQIDYIGGAISASAGSDFTYISSSGLSQYNDRLMDLLADVMLNPNFPEDELKLKKVNKVQELKIQRAKPEFLVDERFSEVVFGQHPYSITAPKPQDVERTTREELVNFHRQNFLPNESILVVVGDFKKPEMKSIIEKEFGGWASGKTTQLQLTSCPKQTGMMIHLVDRPNSVQSSFKMGNLGIKRKDPDYYAAQVTNQVLGGGAIARLFQNLREKHGFTYGAYSQSSARREPGYFSAEANVRTEVTGPALKEFLSELTRMRSEPVSEKELAEAKSYMVGVFQLGLETQGGLAQRLLEGQLYELPDDYLEKFGERVMAVTSADVNRVAKRIIDTDNLVVCVVGDKAKIKADLDKIGPTTVYDVTGRVVEKPTAPINGEHKSMAGSN